MNIVFVSLTHLLLTAGLNRDCELRKTLFTFDVSWNREVDDDGDVESYEK